MGISTLYGHQVFKSFEILKINLIVPTKMKKEKRWKKTKRWKNNKNYIIGKFNVEMWEGSQTYVPT